MNLTDKHNPASRMIYLLCELLRESLNSKTYITSIREEIDFAKTYVEIENLKHNNSFDIEWKYNENVLDYKTVKLILQPILENAFKHGLKKLHYQQRGEIEISIYEQNDDIVFSIKDNGVGIAPDKLQTLKTNLNKNELQSNKHIGLYNVNQRINLLFDKNHGVDIESDKNGTTVYITIPKNM